MEESIIEKYAREQGWKLSALIDEKMAVVLKPRPWYCPKWLYKKIIQDSVGIINS